MFTGKSYLTLLEITFATVLLSPLYLNHKGLYNISAVVFFGITYGLVLKLSIRLPERELEYLFLILAIVPLTSYRSKIIIYSFFLLSFALFVVMKIYAYGYRDNIIYLNFALIFITTFFTVKYLKDEFEENVGVIETQNDRLQKLNDEKNQLISIASHDLRSPLNRIQSLLSLLGIEGSLTQEQKDILRTAQREAKQQTEMISEILDVYAIDEGRKTVVLSSVDSLKLIPELISSFQPIAAKKNISIQFENKANTTAVLADESMLKQILENLFSNAIKFSYANSSVTALLRSSPKTIIISVKDQGQGLDAEDHKKLFNRFQKLSEANRR